MNTVVAGALGQIFRGSTEPSYREMLLRHQRAENERRERDEKMDDAKTDDLDLAMAVVVTAAEMDEFRIELDRYDTATVAALQLNERELILARERLDKLLGEAHVLPDGRRVFETEDGLRVFDEHGRELDASVISPEEIEDSRPRWETAKPIIDGYKALAKERTELLEYQEKLDHARERLDAGDLTREEFDDLRDELKADMPDAVREQLPELEQEQETAAEADAAPAEADAAPADELEISDDMVPTSSKPSGLAFDR